ncbi:hypothetical protein SALLE_v1c03960 [Spiroplasma alleghenense]|uniref:Uncharacterized protein n=1 Tax=Spiroplasma alleghenense TaxID=216931 RepID=A0A345Z391_9MOLU|nr:hypothetical protein SALLE_v1c03960 [Spiroplasma alleghenense]
MGLFLNSLDDNTIDFVLEEITGAINLFLAFNIFSEQAKILLDKNRKDLNKLQIVKQEIFEESPTEMQIYKFVFNNFERPEDVVSFSQKAIESIWFNPNYPVIVLQYLSKNDINENDFSQLLIVSIKDDFINYFVNEVNIEDWKKEMISIIVENSD